MTNFLVFEKRKKDSAQRLTHHRNCHIDRITSPPPAKRTRKRSVDPEERSWAHAYLRHAAETKRFPFDGARESMQILARYFEIELPEGNGAARRSSVAIELAKAIQAKTGIALPEARP